MQWTETVYIRVAVAIEKGADGVERTVYARRPVEVRRKSDVERRASEQHDAHLHYLAEGQYAKEAPELCSAKPYTPSRHKADGPECERLAYEACASGGR